MSLAPVRLDICVLADIRVGDVAAPCHAAALAALARAGYRIGVLPIVSAAIAADPWQLDDSYLRLFAAGDLVCLAPGAVVDCGLALGFDARLFAARAGRGLRLTARHRVVTVERPLALASLGRREIDRLAVAAGLALGGAPLWAPSSRAARDALAHCAPDWRLSETDWAPVAPGVEIARGGAPIRLRPVIGRARIARSRPQPADFGGPAAPAGLVPMPAAGAGTEDPPPTVPPASNGVSPSFSAANVAWRLRVGPAATLPRWPQPAPIEIWPDERIALPDFLAGLSLLANDDSAEADPVPVEALMALGAGVIPCLAPGHRDEFGEAALYGAAGEIEQLAIDLHGNSELAEAMQAAGQDLLRLRYGAAEAVARVKALIGAPRNDSFAPAVHAEPRRSVLFYSTDGIGMGHLTRQLAIARRLPERIAPVFVSHSQAVDIARGFGFAAEHLPYHASYGEDRAHWNAALADTLAAMIAFWKPSALVYDGNLVFPGLLAALDQAPQLARIWIRRGFWGPGRDPEALAAGGFFDLIAEPGDPAEAYDDGPTAARPGEALRLPPVRLLDTDELPSRAEACAALGLDPAAVNVLIAPGSGNNSDTGKIAARALDLLAGRAGIGVALAEWRMAGESILAPAGVVRLGDYPFARATNAFDFALAAAGYNTFVEHLASALPTVWLPNEAPEQDRQILRARFAEDAGLGLVCRLSEATGLAGAIAQMRDPGRRGAMLRAGQDFAGRVLGRNGAVEAAAAVAGLAGSVMVRGDRTLA